MRLRSRQRGPKGSPVTHPIHPDPVVRTFTNWCASVDALSQDREALKPCPFCGQALLIRNGVNAYGYCGTADCWAHERRTMVPLADPAQVAAWNTRAAPSEREQAVREALTKPIEPYDALIFSIPNQSDVESEAFMQGFAYGRYTGLDSELARHWGVSRHFSAECCPVVPEVTNLLQHIAALRAALAATKAEDHPVAGEDVVQDIAERLANGETESQQCEHVESACGGGMSGICVLCGADLMVERANALLAERAARAEPAPDALAEMREKLERAIAHIEIMGEHVPDLLESIGYTDEEGVIGEALEFAKELRSLLATEGR